MSTDDNLRSAILNLHDTYMNANLLRALTNAEPVDAVPDEVHKWTVSNRARLERMWWAMTYVLIEAWRARGADVRHFIASCSASSSLEERLDHLEASGVVAKLRECRHYMCHRDRRAYWDEGRMAPIGHLEEVLELGRAFGEVFLEALPALESH